MGAAGDTIKEVQQLAESRASSCSEAVSETLSGWEAGHLAGTLTYSMIDASLRTGARARILRFDFPNVADVVLSKQRKLQSR